MSETEQIYRRFSIAEADNASRARFAVFVCLAAILTFSALWIFQPQPFWDAAQEIGLCCVALLVVGGWIYQAWHFFRDGHRARKARSIATAWSSAPALTLAFIVPIDRFWDPWFTTKFGAPEGRAIEVALVALLVTFLSYGSAKQRHNDSQFNANAD